jgi:hypothetical protein
MTSAASALTVFLARSPFEANRCPIDAADRPPGCPKRATEVEGDCACEPARQ